jgi:four helix bundle protein
MEQDNQQTRYFSHERLSAYQLALNAFKLVAARRQRLMTLPGGLGSQLERAVVGAFSNLCSGAAARGGEAKRQLRIALSEAGEAGGCAEGAFVLGALTEAEYSPLRDTLLRLCACLNGLAR